MTRSALSCCGNGSAMQCVGTARDHCKFAQGLTCFLSLHQAPQLCTPRGQAGIHLGFEHGPPRRGSRSLGLLPDCAIAGTKPQLPAGIGRHQGLGEHAPAALCAFRKEQGPAGRLCGLQPTGEVRWSICSSCRPELTQAPLTASAVRVSTQPCMRPWSQNTAHHG